MASLISSLKATKAKISKKKPAVKSSSQEALRKKIEEQAYYLYEKRGCLAGFEVEDWLEAEKLVKASQEKSLGD